MICQLWPPWGSVKELGKGQLQTNTFPRYYRPESSCFPGHMHIFFTTKLLRVVTYGKYFTSNHDSEHSILRALESRDLWSQAPLTDNLCGILKQDVYPIFYLSVFTYKMVMTILIVLLNNCGNSCETYKEMTTGPGIHQALNIFSLLFQ